MATIRLGDIAITVTRKAVKHVHLSVHPPRGRVTLVAPTRTRLEVARAYAVSKLRWIRQQQARFRAQARETPRRFVTRETHFLWGRRYLLKVEYADVRPVVKLSPRQITVVVRPGSDAAKRAEVLHKWHKAQLHSLLPRMIETWERRLDIKVHGYFLQRMRTRWGSCNPTHGHIRLNTELVKKPIDLLEYVVVHEMAHFIVPTHNERFVALLDRHYPSWREARAELNTLPIPGDYLA